MRETTNLIDHVLEIPAYGWQDLEGRLIIPFSRQIFKEFWFRLNIFKTKKNWLSFSSWFKVMMLVSCLFIFLLRYFNFYWAGAVFLYSMVIMGTHGTIWYHRYCTHAAYTFSNKFWRFVTRNLTIKVVPEEIYVISHHVHHARSDQPGDPYNASAAFWGTVFHLIGGPALVFALFGSAGVWAIGVRTFNFEGHGKGKDKRRDGADFNRKDPSINQLWPGFVAGEWHNNHHLYPSSARSGFLRYQLDLAWCYIKLMSVIGAVATYHDSKKAFLHRYWQPYIRKRKTTH